MGELRYGKTRAYEKGQKNLTRRDKTKQVQTRKYKKKKMKSAIFIN
jgi:hypothetical protein